MAKNLPEAAGIGGNPEMQEVEEGGEGGGININHPRAQEGAVGSAEVAVASIPSEVWEIMMDCLVRHPDTMWNLNLVLGRFASDDYFQGCKKEWFLGKVAIEMMKWINAGFIDQETIPKFRGISVASLSSINKSLENQPALKAYEPGDRFQQDPGPMLLPLTRFWNLKAYKFKTNPPFHAMRPQHFGGVRVNMNYLGGNRTIQSFTQEFQSSQPGSNPFISRLLIMEISSRIPQQYPHLFRMGMMRRELIEFHRLFGHHVWYYILEFVTHDLYIPTLEELLMLMPNLKSLELKELRKPLDLGPNTENHASALRCHLQPEMPNLKTLKLSTIHRTIAAVLLHKYHQQLRWVEMELFHYPSFNLELETFLPKVTELDLVISTQGYFHFPMNLSSEKFLIRLLQELNSPNLVKISLTGPETYSGSYYYLFIDDVVKSLSKFPNLLVLDFGTTAGGIIYSDSHQLDPKMHGNREKNEKGDTNGFTVEFLSIKDSYALTYNFLICFPKLRKLQIFVDVPDHRRFNDPISKINLREAIELRNLYDSSSSDCNIWEILPKLQEVEIIEEENGNSTTFTFTRAQYEYENLF